MDHDARLQERFGLAAFRPWQREAVDALLHGPGRALVIAPTGGGKSLCYQYPATQLRGTTVVVSPLIALMDDQVRGLAQRGIRATYLASTLDLDERRAREEALFAGELDLVYVAPERLRSDYLVRRLRELTPPLVAIDEAHCISHWGHDFRPDYLRIREFLDAVRPARVVACTATATPSVRQEIAHRLGIDEAGFSLVMRGFARPNLHLQVEELDGFVARAKVASRRLTEVLGGPGERRPGAAIVYAGTRKNTERLAARLAEEGWRTAAYHAGLEADVRERVSEHFAAGSLEVVVATNAFGMGIDRPDIRVVVHIQAPGSIEQYYQEVGRAGRDGEPAHGLLLAGSSDFAFRKRLLALGEEEHDPAHLEHQWQLFLDLMRYVEAGSCRHDFILRYFGDEGETLGGCGHCDVCERFDGALGEPAVTPEDALVVRKALSGVARLKRRAGLSVLASHLRGEDNQRQRQLGLPQLSTHGLLAAYPVKWISSLLRRLMTAGLVDVTPGDYPVPYLTGAGRETMKGTREVRVILPPRATKKSSKKRRADERAALSGDDAALFERLRGIRADLAAEKGVPAYVVCHNRTLEEMAQARPVSVEAMRQVHGMGPARIDAYGDRFLAALRDA
ncbi:MAG: ATP-dependent DNA helicase RecQ [Myxococcota bacterium]